VLQPLLEIARDPRHLGAEIGFFRVLHTRNQRLQHHSHVHCVAAAGGLTPDHMRWIPSRHTFFLPVKVLSRVFRGKFVAGLKNAFHQNKLEFYGYLAPLAEPRTFAAWLRSLFRHDWVVYAKPPFGGPEHALRYLSGYTHRIAISNRRLVALEQGNVTFRWRDSAHANKQRLLTLPVDEFLRRFLLHLLPRGFTRIRNSASWPTGNAPRCCRSASSCSQSDRKYIDHTPESGFLQVAVSESPAQRTAATLVQRGRSRYSPKTSEE
jgi:hypothetical protein